ncbi:MAG: hypothetical protein B7Z73_08910 [Planctomycetia bacterium 21-64-5]|nr:MAG: hypothetical protein B7Z73_08910 [Planctomycetia bacterium 21-64-5]
MGVLFYEMLTGRRPYRRTEARELLDEISGGDVRPPRQFDHTIPKELERICLKALGHRPADRYATAFDMADDLRRWQSGSEATETQAADLPATSLPRSEGGPEKDAVMPRRRFKLLIGCGGLLTLSITSTVAVFVLTVMHRSPVQVPTKIAKSERPKPNSKRLNAPQPDPSVARAKTTVPSPAIAASPSSQWLTPIVLPGGGSLSPEQVQLEGSQLAEIDKGMSKTAFEFKNEKSPKGELLVHSAWSAKKKQTLSLNGWTIFRHENGTPKLAVEFDDDNRTGPLRYWDENGKLRLYANYAADKLSGPACFFQNGLPVAIMNYAGGQLTDQYVVDYSSGTPEARPIDRAAPEVAEEFSVAEKQFQDLAADIQEQETHLKTWLRDAYTKVQVAMITRSKYVRARNKASEQKMRADNEAAIARGISALAIGTGAGF